MRWLILSIIVYISGLNGNSNDLKYQPKTSVLIIGSSIPALISALHLTDQNISVTILYPTSEIENQISATTNIVKDVVYRLPKYHPAIFENSIEVRSLASRFGNNFLQLDELNLLVNEKKILSISSNEYVYKLIISALTHKCLSWLDLLKIEKIIRAIRNYNPTNDKVKFSNITFLEFARLNNAPQKFISCFLKSSLIDLGSQVETINAADALARMQFYYLKKKNGLRSYHMNNLYSSKNNSKLLVDQIINQLKLKNTTFKSNYSLEAFWVDPSSGRILGDINNRKIQYDYVIVGDTLQQSRRILATTQSYNSGDPKVFQPLKSVLESLNQYSNATKILSLKFWFSQAINTDRKLLLAINNSPYPFSIQSIRQINKLSGEGNPGNILEIIVADSNSSNINWTKISTELSKILPELKDASLNHLSCDPIDLGVLMDTKFGTHRLSASSVIKFGISNLILAGDWLDATDSIAADLEKSFVIGKQAAMEIIKRVKFKQFINF